ncbi:hypothetical protein GCM10020000_23160 [Streptomyces olivoverticillatus]
MLREATDVIMRAITELLAELRGEPAPAEPYNLKKARAATRREAGSPEGDDSK